jgi:hypothetical protein
VIGAAADRSQRARNAVRPRRSGRVPPPAGCWWCSVISEDVASYEAMVARAEEVAQQEGFAQAPDLIVVVAGIPFKTPGTTNNLRVVELGRSGAA